MKTIVLTLQAAKDLDALSFGVRKNIIGALNAYAINGVGDIRKLAGRGGYRLCVGRYQVLFAEDQTTILAVYISKRETTTYSRN